MTFFLPKETPGHSFDDLDLLSELLKKPCTLNDRQMTSKLLVEEVDSDEHVEANGGELHEDTATEEYEFGDEGNNVYFDQAVNHGDPNFLELDSHSQNIKVPEVSSLFGHSLFM